MIQKPKQRIPLKEKNAKWVEDCVRYYKNAAKPIIEQRKANMLYNVAFGILDEHEYLYVTNPRNTTRDSLKGYPSKMRNIPIGPPIFAVLMGEKSKRFIDYQVININSDLESNQIAEETKMLLQAMQNDLYNQINQGNPQQQGNEVLTTEQIKAKLGDIVDEIAIQGQESIDYIRFYNDLDRKFKELFFDALTLNCFASMRDVVNDEVMFTVIPPIELSIVANRNITFIEEAETVVRRTKMTISDIYDAFSDFDNFKSSGLEEGLKSDLDQTVENPSPRRLNGFTDLDIRLTNYGHLGAAAELFDNLGYKSSMHSFENEEAIYVDHIVWTSYVKRGVLLVVDLVEGIQEIEVDEDYIIAEGEEVEWTWVRQQFHAYHINDNYVLGGVPIITTRASVNNPNRCKSLYNGMIMPGISTAELVLPYQIKHNIGNYYIEKLIGRHRADIIVFPISLMPDGKNEAGIDFETSLYYADADGYLIVDDSDKNKLQALQYMKILNSSVDKTLREMMSILQANKQELEDMIGINRFRKGQTNSSDGKYVSQQGEYRGSLMSEHLFSTVDDCHTKDLQVCLDLSQLAFIKGKKAHYISSDFKNKFLNIVNPEAYSTAVFGVGMNNSARGREKMQLMNAYTQALAQDPNVPKTVIPRMINADSMAEMIKQMDSVVADFEKKQAQMSELEHQREIEVARVTLEKLTKELDFKYYKTDADNIAKVEAAAVSNKATPQDDSGIVNAAEDRFLKSQELRVKNAIESAKLQLEREKIASQERQTKMKADSAEKVARINPPNNSSKK